MTVAQLPKEVWTCIAQHTRVPLPTNPRDVKNRKEIRQVDCCNLMTVSKLLNNATAPTLYTAIIVDDLAGLFHNFSNENPVSPGIPSKKQLLRLTRILYLEYPERPLSNFHTSHLFDHHDTSPRGVSYNLPDDEELGFYIPHPALAALIDFEMLFGRNPSTRLQNSMPDLQILACATLFGTYEDGWSTKFGGIRGWMHRVYEAQKEMGRMYMEGNIKHYCQSGNWSPFCVHPHEIHDSALAVTSNPARPLSRSLTLHQNLKDIKMVDYDHIFRSCSSLPDREVRWCFDDPRPNRAATPLLRPFLGFPDRPRFGLPIFLSFVTGLDKRHNKKTNHTGSPEFVVVPFHVDAYIPLNDSTTKMLLGDSKVTQLRGSTAKEKTANKRREAASRLGAAMSQANQELIHKVTKTKILHPDDHLQIHYIADCPPCLACGWLPVGKAD